MKTLIAIIIAMLSWDIYMQRQILAQNRSLAGFEKLNKDIGALLNRIYAKNVAQNKGISEQSEATTLIVSTISDIIDKIEEK